MLTYYELFLEFFFLVPFMAMEVSFILIEIELVFKLGGLTLTKTCEF